MAAKKKKSSRVLVIVLMVFMILLSAVLMAYPAIARWNSEQSKSEIQTEYEEIIQENDTSHLDALREAAYAYNEAFYNGDVDLLNVEASGYHEMLSVNGTSVMARIRIPAINVDLPVYHTDNEEVLHLGAGHLEQSSLPVGGENTHAVISAHSGMASAEMFSNLERMEIGDLFFIDVLGETLTYEVRTIETVLPDAIRSVSIEQGLDLVTLITCTPYGVNTHRLLVTGARIETPTITDEDGNEVVDIPDTEVRDSGSVWMEHYIKALLIGAVAAIVFILICCLIMHFNKKKRKQNRTQIKWSVKTYTIEKAGDENGIDEEKLE